MKVDHTNVLVRLSLNPPVARGQMTWEVSVDNGLLRATLVKYNQRPTKVLYKLDELHEALILEVIVANEARLRAQLKVSDLLGDTELLEVRKHELATLRAARLAIGHRREYKTTEEVPA